MGAVLAIAPGAMAQSLETTTPLAKRETPPPALPDRDLRPTPPPVPHTPGFLTPLTRTTMNGRVGIAGWTAPNPAVGARGAADPESSGVFGFGLAAEWGRSIPPRELPSLEGEVRGGGGGGVGGSGVDGPTGLK